MISTLNSSTSDYELIEEKTKVISARVTERYAELLVEYVRKNAYVSRSDLIRGALREKLQGDAPELCQRILKEKTSV